MKHIDLIKLIHSHRDIIDRAYRQGWAQNVDAELEEATLFVKINDKYKLNKNYLNFVDSVLQRVDYSIIFGDYEKEYKELVKMKRRYLESKNDYYKSSIITLIENLYFKFYNRDREIQLLILRLENDISLDIDILIENAQDVLSKIEELTAANQKIGLFFRVELRGVEESIDTLLQNISVDILKFIENIDSYIKEVNQFIVQTQKRRLQNKQIAKLSNMIVDEQSQELDEYLQMHHKRLYFTVNRSQKNRVEILPSDSDIVKLKKELKKILVDIEVEKPLKEVRIKPQQVEKLDIINVEVILQKLQRDGSEDIFMDVRSHKELEKYSGAELMNEAFKVYLQIISDERVIYENSFNEYGVKVAKWA